MRLHGGLTIVQHQIIGGQIFAKVCHPSVNPDLQGVLFNDLILEPLVGFRVRKVHYAAVKLTKVHKVIAAIGPGGKHAFFLPSAYSSPSLTR